MTLPKPFLWPILSSPQSSDLSTDPSILIYLTVVVIDLGSETSLVLEGNVKCLLNIDKFGNTKFMAYAWCMFDLF